MSIDSIQVISNKPMQLGECPLWYSEENTLYWIDISKQTIHSLHEASLSHRYWPMPSEPGCIAKHCNGGLIVALRTGLIHLNTINNKITTLQLAPYNANKIRFNDGRCDAMGRLWIGTIYEPRDLKNGSLFCFDRGILKDTVHPVITSNGIAFSVDQHTIYHTDTFSHCIHAYDFNLYTGQTSNGRLFKQFDTNKSMPNYGGRPDGAAVDSENTYWCAMFEGGCILQISPHGKILQKIKLPVCCPTMLAFGGIDLQTLYITSSRIGRSPDELKQYPLSGYTLALRVKVKGQYEYSYKN